MFNVPYWEACLDENDDRIKIICIKKKIIIRGQKSKYIEHSRKSKESRSMFVNVKYT